MPAAIRPPDASPPSQAAAEPHPAWWRGLHAFALDLGASLEAADCAAAAMRHLPSLLDADLVALRFPPLHEDCAWSAGPPGERLTSAAWEAVERGAGTGKTDDDGAVHRADLPDGGSVLWAEFRQTNGPSGVILAGWAGQPPADAAPRLRASAAHLASAAARAGSYAALREASLGRDRYFSALGHDLRTPITAIVGYGELLHDGIVGPLTAQQADMVERITHVAADLSRMVDDVLDLARLDTGRLVLHLETASVPALVDEAVGLITPRARRKGLELHNGIAAGGVRRVRADLSRVRQILGSLLDNAVRFTKAGSVVVTAGEVDGSGWIEVADTGPGLPPGSEETLFDEFLEFAAGRGGHTKHGRGLSLAISRRLARAMGGDLVARSRPGAGAAFTLYLPAAEEPEPPGG